jgi:electron transfer flavoprotein beta subunit
MNIVVCIKQVPDTTDVRIDPETNTLIREGVDSILNPFDRYAVEEAIRIKEKTGAKTIALSMGPPQSKAVLAEAISMGIDQAVHLSDRAFAGSDTWSTSLVLAKAVKRLSGILEDEGKGPVDLIICGKQASDGDTAQVGPGIATHLDFPQATYVRKIDSLNIDSEPKFIVLERLVEEGFEILEVKLPALITVVKEINEPRLPSLRGKMKARKQEIPVWNHKDLEISPEMIGLKGSPTQVIKVFSPPQKIGGKMLKGEPYQIVEDLIKGIKDRL